MSFIEYMDNVHRTGPETRRMLRNHIFISYSHRDQKYLDELLVYLKHWQDEGLLDVWSDQRLEASQDWHEEIQKAIGKNGGSCTLRMHRGGSAWNDPGRLRSTFRNWIVPENWTDVDGFRCVRAARRQR